MTRLINNILNNIWLMPGFRTTRKLIAFVVDDYGSIRISSRDSYENLVRYGLRLESSRFTRFDTLESNNDLEQLFEVLTSFRDHVGNYPAFTPMVCVANPDFEKIKGADYTQYFYEPFTETLKKYPDHDKVYSLWKEGIERSIFVPQFHAREHLNIQRWMTDLRHGVKSTIRAFDQGISGIGPGEAPDIFKDYQAAFDIDDANDIEALKVIIKDGLHLFTSLTGYKAVFFSPANSFFNHNLDSVLNEGGIELVNAGKSELEPVGQGRYKRTFHYSYQKNWYNQLYLLRNALFEPNQQVSFNWIDRCMHDIETAFRWRKPAIISSHRVNFSGHLVPNNRQNGLKMLEQLLSMITKRWPDCEFVSIRDIKEIVI